MYLVYMKKVTVKVEVCRHKQNDRQEDRPKTI